MSDPSKDIDAWLEEEFARIAKRQLRRERPWAYDIARVLVSRPAGLNMQRIYEEVRSLRSPSELSKPKEFEAVVRSVIYGHSSQSPKWSGNEHDDLFKSPRRGIWQVDANRTAAWLKRHETEIVGTEPL